ncbi:hypothetical protein KO505_08480 [Psychrosphaera sp. F3M07]|jgi:hypothetical protein|nr:hypothetical protein [Psychrosphaera sp. F3M07]
MIFLIDYIEQYINNHFSNTDTKAQITECNYQDNYYGDQVCQLINK